jgi:tRNA modification GTPase
MNHEKPRRVRGFVLLAVYVRRLRPGEACLGCVTLEPELTVDVDRESVPGMPGTAGMPHMPHMCGMKCSGEKWIAYWEKFRVGDLMKTQANDTIVAIATPSGDGAVSVIRISGPGAIAVADRVFRGSEALSDVEGNSVRHGHVVDADGTIVDEVVATLFRGPRSYSGEDVVEISCHGGIYVTQKVLEVLLTGGARQAEPGEFTKRAFLNGKLDLSQAEAVADLISARSERAHALSMSQLEGKLGNRVKSLRTRLLGLCALLELELDFSEEGLDLVTRDEIGKRLRSLDDELMDLEESFSIGRIFREGVTVALAGETNAGKSSLFNALLREERAIVTPIPGTTRDTIEEDVVIRGVLFSLVDTAGLRDSDDLVEIEGMSRTRSIIRNSDIIIVVVDGSVTTDRGAALAHFSGLHPSQRLIIAYNKVDLVGAAAGLAGEFRMGDVPGIEVRVSAKTGSGLRDLRDCLAGTVDQRGFSREETSFLTNRRHLDAVVRARRSLRQGAASLHDSASNELVAFDAREASEALATITGEVTNDDVLNQIFSTFCIGK